MQQAELGVLSTVKLSMPSPWTGRPVSHHACGDLPELMFGMRMPGEMPTVHGPLPEIEVTLTGSTWPRPGRPFAELPDGLQTPERSEEHTSELQSQSNIVCR